MQTIDYFRGLESTEKALRGDAYEGLAGIYQASKLTHITIADIRIPATDIASPLTFHLEACKHWHVFCLHTIGITPDSPQDIDNLDDLKKAILLDERCGQLGGYLVFLTDAKAFIKRTHAAIRKLGFASRSNLVSYYDDLLFHGFFDDDDVPFRKARRFAYQKEFRIVAKTPKGVASPLVVDIGDISGIATLTTPEKFAESVTVTEDK